MKTHRPWQPHMGNSPLFNPYTPAGQSTTIDHYDFTEEVEQEDQESQEPQGEKSDEELRNEAVEQPPVINKD